MLKIYLCWNVQVAGFSVSIFPMAQLPCSPTKVKKDSVQVIFNNRL